MNREIIASIGIASPVPGYPQRYLSLSQDSDGSFTLTDTRSESLLTTVTTEYQTLMLDWALWKMNEIAKAALLDSHIMSLQPDKVRRACANL